MNFVEFLRTPFFIEHLRWLLPLDINHNKRIVFAGDFNIFQLQYQHVSELDAKDGKPLQKRKFIPILVEIKETLYLIYDIWRIRNSIN